MSRAGAASRPGSSPAVDEGRYGPHGSGVPALGDDEPPDPLIGRTLPSGHQLLDLVGVGGMGRVYRAVQTALGRTVAIKFVHPHLIHDETIQTRFLTEARAASQLNHPNSVSVIDFGLFEGAPYLVMEYLWGDDLASIIAEEAPLDDARIARLLGQVLDALEEAHHLGIVHRDLKPENIIVQRLRSNAEMVKVLDFGLAKLHEQLPTKRATVPGLVCGTPQFMAPEQVRGEMVDGRADLYACGVILFEMLTGVLPFDAPSVGEIIAMQLNDPPPDPRFLVPDRELDGRVVDVVMRALAKPVTERFQSAVEFAEALRGAMLGEPDDTGRHSGQRARCPRCQAVVRLGQHFCGHCGSTLAPAPPRSAPSNREARAGGGSAPPTSQPSPSSAPSEARRRASSSPPASLPSRVGLLGRAGELEELSAAFSAAAKGPMARRVVGPSGVGKSTLLRAFERSAEAEGARVLRCGPDDWQVGVRFACLRELVTKAVGAPDAGGPPHWSGAPTDARLGYGRLFGRATTHEAAELKRWSDGPPHGWRSGEVRAQLDAAVRWAVVQASGRDSGHPLVVTIDDLHHVDGTSAAVVGSLVSDPLDAPVLIVAAHDADFTPAWPRVRAIELEGLPLELCAELLARVGVAPGAALPETDSGSPRGLRPIVVEQLHWLLRSDAAHVPDQLADMITQRLEGLPNLRRRLLQLIAVLGAMPADASLAALGLPLPDPAAELGRLRREGWLEHRSDELRRLHPLVRDVVLGNIPHEARRMLHERAFTVAAAADSTWPIEVRAHHAEAAELAFEALVLLEQVATRHALAGDLEGATLALRRGVELARREISRGMLDDPIGATAWFASRLADILTLREEPNQADGVLRESLDAVGPASPLRPRLLASLAFASKKRGRTEQAHSQLDEAMALARQHGKHGVLRACAELRQSWAMQ